MASYSVTLRQRLRAGVKKPTILNIAQGFLVIFSYFDKLIIAKYSSVLPPSIGTFVIREMLALAKQINLFGTVESKYNNNTFVFILFSLSFLAHLYGE